MKIKVNTHNHWDPIEEIFVGIADNAMLPTMNRSVRSFSYADYDPKSIKDLQGPVDKKIIEEANEDLDKLAETLSDMNIIVRRPKIMDHSIEYSTPDWKTTGWCTYCPRDLLLPIGDTIIDCPSPMRARHYETLAYRDYLLDVTRNGGKWISAPKPRLLDSVYQFDNLDDPTTLNHEIIFDAPNVVKLGKDLLYQVSNSGTLLGGQWLKNLFEPQGYRIHIAERFYTYSHFDSTVIPLQPGLVLFNGARCNPDWYPPIFKKWDKIFMDPKNIVDIGSALPDNASPCSPFIGLNLLVVKPGLVICDINQDELRKTLNRYGIDSIGLPMRHARALAGGFHCVTLDTVRTGTREDYFS